VSRYIDEHRERFGVAPICRAVGVSASAYYQRAAGQRSAREVEDERLLDVIRTTHQKNFEVYGYRRMWRALRRLGERAPRCRVQRLMRDNGTRGAKRRGKPWRTTKPDPGAQRPRDLVKRNFTASAPNRLWVGDFTYLRCWEGVVYFGFVIDVYSRMVAGGQHAHHAGARRAQDGAVLEGARADFRLVAHTDAGSQYTSDDYTQVLDDDEVLASIGTVGDALDNALAESFVDSYKTELIADRVWRTRAQLELATVEYIGWFNHDRLHESLGDIPPVEFEQFHCARQVPIPDDGSVTGISPRAADGLRTRRFSAAGIDIAVERLISSENALAPQTPRARTAAKALAGRDAVAGLRALRSEDHRSNRK
jgi:putative transposase